MADAGFRLTVEGEKEFKSALAAIDAQIKTNKAELKLLTEQYALSDDSMDGLVEKQKKLGEAYEAQAEKVRLLEDQYRQSAETYGENDAAVRKLKDSMIAAQTALASMANEQEKNQRAMDAARESMERQKAALAEYDETVRQLDGSFAEMDAGIEENSRRLAELAERYDTLGGSSGDLRKKQENLKQQNELLNTGMETQKKKIDALNTGLRESEKLFGGNSEEVADYKKKLDAATSELEEMERQIGENNEALKDTAGDGGNQLHEILEKIEDTTGLEIPDSIKKVIGGFDDATIAAGGIAGAVGTAITKLSELSANARAWADEIAGKSLIMGIDTDELQALEYAATTLGVSTDTIDDALNEISVRAGETHEIVGKYMNDFGALQRASEEERKAVTDAIAVWEAYGVNLYTQEGVMKSSIEVLHELLEYFSSMPSSMERTNQMVKIFGESARLLNPIIETGVDNFKKLQQEAYESGVVLNDSVVREMDAAAAKSEQWSMKLGTLTKAIGAAFQQNFSLQGLLKPVEYLYDKITGNTYEPYRPYATGTYNHPGGYAVVGERGPEIVDLPRGSKVYPNGEIPDGMGGTVNYINVTISASDIREFNDIVRIVQSQRQSIRGGYVGR